MLRAYRSRVEKATFLNRFSYVRQAAPGLLNV